MMEPIVNSISATYSDRIRVIRVDVDRNTYLVAKYRIRAKPTFLFIKNGKVIDTVTFPIPREDFEGKTKRLLAME